MRTRLICAVSALTAVAAVAIPAVDAGAKAPRDDRQARLTGAVQRLVAPEFEAALTVSKSGLVVSVPSSVTTFNKAKVRIAPSAHASSGVHRQVTTRRITVYSGKKRVASGSSVRLRIGRYKQSVTVGYIAYKFVTRQRRVTEQQYVPGDYPSGTICSITAVSASGNGPGDDVIDSASCTNRGYPQRVAVNGSDLYDVPQDDGQQNYSVGQQVVTGAVYFDSYTKTVSRLVSYQVRVNTGRGHVVTRRSTLVVKDGGYLKIWSGADTSTRKIKFTTTKKSRWAYAIYCGDYGYFGVNWYVGDAGGDFGPQEGTPAGNSSHAYNSRYVGRSEFHVFANDCYWALGVASKGRIR